MQEADIVLKVGTATDPASFAGAIFKNIEEGKRVSARALGASANYTMCKGVHIAQEFFASHGMQLLCQIHTRKETMRGDEQIRSFTVEFHVLEAGEDPFKIFEAAA